jgi:glycogen debranching enzyme
MTIEKAYEEAIEVLKKNATKNGFSASTEKVVNYYSIWARDHSICALAALQTEDQELIVTAKKGVLHLLQNQSDAGQIPSYIEIEKKTKVYGGLGSITSIDSNLWIVIAAAKIYKQTRDARFLTATQIRRYKRLYRLIRAFDSNNCGLMEVHVASDWADIMQRSYHVLYDECLHHQALKSLTYLFTEYMKNCKDEDLVIKIPKHIRWIKTRITQIKPKINADFWFTHESIPKVKEKYMIYHSNPQPMPFYQSHLMPFEHEWDKRFDTFGNMLAIITGIAPKERRNTILQFVTEHKINEPAPLKVLSPVILPQEPDWHPVYALKEAPNTYHNGGIWPLVTGFWIEALVKGKKNKLAKKELQRFAKLLEDSKWLFPEYFHGETLTPMGRNFQAWSAAGYILGYNALKNKSVF